MYNIALTLEVCHNSIVKTNLNTMKATVSCNVTAVLKRRPGVKINSGVVNSTVVHTI